MRHCVVFSSVLLGAAVLAVQAVAGPFFTSSRPQEAHPGQLITLRAGMGVRVRDLMPLYLVPTRLAPAPYICDHGKGTCEHMARHAPDSTPYIRVATLDVRHAPGSPMAGYSVTIRYRLPETVRKGRYAYLLYCRWCGRKGSGSLIAWPTGAGKDGPTVGTALVVR